MFAKVKNTVNWIKSLSKRDISEESSARAWQQYDKILLYRANLTMISKIMLSIGNLLTVQTPYHLSLKFVELDRVYNEQYVESTVEYLRIAYLVLLWGRLPLVLFSFKKLDIARIYIYY